MNINLINDTFYRAAIIFAIQIFIFAVAKFANNNIKIIDNKYDDLLSPLLGIIIISEFFIGSILLMYLALSLGYGIKLSFSFINEVLTIIKLLVPIGIITSMIISIIIFSFSDKTRIKIEKVINCLK